MTRLKLLLSACTAPVLLFVAGCGGTSYSGNPSNSAFSIGPATSTIDNGASAKVSFTATLADGTPASNVNWVIVSGQNNSQLGQGSIDATGVYYPPTAISQDSIQVKIQANLSGNIYQTATAIVTVTPGFIQTVTPENATLSNGASVPVTASLGEVGGGSVKWALSGSPTNVTSPPAGAGSIGGTSCLSAGLSTSNPIYTTCTATYTAPATAPSGTVYVVATVANNTATVSASRLLLNNAGLNTSPLENQASQTGSVQMGASGGNNNDVDVDSNGNVTDCASGTLGALLRDQASNLYILSNNHVLAESDQATVGDTVIHPGLVDTGCTQLATGVSGINAIGTLKYWVRLIDMSANTDAALATASSSVDTSGAILAFGASGGGTNQIAAAPPAGGTGEVLTAANLNNIHVAKSGRSTGLTCSTVDTINTTVKISYFKDAAETQPYVTRLFTNQIGVPGNYFSDQGDSGSLLVDANNAQAIGLFFGSGLADGSSTLESFANPIGDVFADLAQRASAPAGTSFSIVGGGAHAVNCLNYDANTANPSLTVSVERMKAARSIVNQKAASLIDPSKGVLGVAAGKSFDQPGQAAVLVYVDHAGASVPQSISGLPTRVVVTTATAVANGSVAEATATTGIHLPQATLDAARTVQKQQAAKLMHDPAFFGVGVTQSQDNPAEAALMIFIDRTKTPRAEPTTVGGLRVRYRTMNPVRINLSGAKSGL